MQSHPAAKSLLNKPLPYYDKFSYVFEKYRATGARVETFVYVKSNVPPGFEEFAHVDLNDTKIPSMSSRGNDSRTCSSDSKWKRGGKIWKIVDVIKDDMAFQTYQLRLIAEWPWLALKDESRVRREVVCALRAIPQLTRLERAQCNRILMNNLADMKGLLELADDEKLDYCTVIVRDTSWLFHLLARLLLWFFFMTLPVNCFLLMFSNDITSHVFLFQLFM